MTVYRVAYSRIFFDMEDGEEYSAFDNQYFRNKEDADLFSLNVNGNISVMNDDEISPYTVINGED